MMSPEGLAIKPADTGQLADLLAVTARAGVDHERNRIVFLLALVVFQRAQHDVRDLVGAMRPDIDDLVVTLAGGNDTLAVLLFDFADLFLRGVDFLIFLLRNDHVIDADGNTGLGGFAEAELLELVQHDDGLFVTADFVAFPDQIPDSLLLTDFVGETHFRRPDLAEDERGRPWFR